jgi:hypothetical protein
VANQLELRGPGKVTNRLLLRPTNDNECVQWLSEASPDASQSHNVFLGCVDRVPGIRLAKGALTSISWQLPFLKRWCTTPLQIDRRKGLMQMARDLDPEQAVGDSARLPSVQTEGPGG